MTKDKSKGGDIIDFVAKRTEREGGRAASNTEEAELQSLFQRVEDALKSHCIKKGIGFVTADSGLIVPDVLGYNKKTEALANAEKYAFDVDKSLIAEGWSICTALSIDNDLLKNKKRFTDLVNWKNVTTRKSRYKLDDKPVLVIYGKN